MILPRALLSVLMVVALTACSGSEEIDRPLSIPQEPGGISEVELVVFAAASLKDAFGAMQADLKRAGVEKVTYNFAGSQALVAQLGQGARADIFASADLKNMEGAIGAGAVVSGTQRVMATNKLAVITPPGGGKVSRLQDLAKPGLKVVLADPSVPAGNYSLQALDKLSADPLYGEAFKEQVLANVVSWEDSVRQVVAKVQLGEADAGIAYTTDARPSTLGSGPALGVVEIPDPFNVLGRYYIAPVKEAEHPDAARLFVDYVLSPGGQEALSSYGFGPPVESK